MPGIAGCTRHTAGVKDIENARGIIRYSSSYSDDELFEDQLVVCTRTHLNLIGAPNSPFHKDGVFCWVEGEFYNQKMLAKEFHIEPDIEHSILVEAYRGGFLERLLNRIDGYFSAVIYDSNNLKILLISDRYGFKPMYYWHQKPYFAWCSELKGLSCLPEFSAEFNTTAMNCFIKTGQLLGNLTWFNDVFLLGASSILSYDLKSSNLEIKKYWTWAEIVPHKFTMDEAIEIGFALLKSAVEKRVSNSRRMALSLSGGLDSRLILANIDKPDNLATITFGRKGALDVIIAKKLALALTTRHHYFELNQENWFQNRIEGIWKVDGMLNFLHLHSSPFQQQFNKFADVCLNGFAGDIILGASWLKNEDKRISPDTAKGYFSEFFGLSDISDPFYCISKEDPYVIDTRVRRFTNLGLVDVGKTMENRMPFFDNEFIEFIYGIPDIYRKDYQLYFLILQKFENDVFRKLPWQKTAMRPGANKFYGKFSKYKILLYLNRLGFPVFHGFTDYVSWMSKQEQIRDFLKESKSLVLEITGTPWALEAPSNSVTPDNIFRLGRLFTLEIWLRQFLYRHPMSTEEFIHFK